MKQSHPLPYQCVNCQASMDGVFAVDGDRAPDPGDVVLCGECGHIMVIASNGQPRNPRGKEFKEIAGDKKILAAQKILESFRFEYNRLLGQFRSQSGKMIFYVVRANKRVMQEIFVRAHAGDKKYQLIAGSLLTWEENVQKMQNEGCDPACAGCGTPARPGQVGGFAIVEPESDQVGIVAAICGNCMEMEKSELQRKIVAAMEQELGTEFHSVQ